MLELTREWATAQRRAVIVEKIPYDSFYNLGIDVYKQIYNELIQINAQMQALCADTVSDYMEALVKFETIALRVSELQDIRRLFGNNLKKAPKPTPAQLNARRDLWVKIETLYHEIPYKLPYREVSTYKLILHTDGCLWEVYTNLPEGHPDYADTTWERGWGLRCVNRDETPKTWEQFLEENLQDFRDNFPKASEEDILEAVKYAWDTDTEYVSI